MKQEAATLQGSGSSLWLIPIATYGHDKSDDELRAEARRFALGVPGDVRICKDGYCLEEHCHFSREVIWQNGGWRT